MHRIRPHLGLTLYSILGATVGTGSVLLWLHVLAPYRLPEWVVFLASAGTALLVLRVLAEAQRRHTRTGRPRRAHARPHTTKTRKAA